MSNTRSDRRQRGARGLGRTRSDREVVCQPRPHSDSLTTCCTVCTYGLRLEQVLPDRARSRPQTTCVWSHFGRAELTEPWQDASETAETTDHPPQPRSPADSISHTTTRSPQTHLRDTIFPENVSTRFREWRRVSRLYLVACTGEKKITPSQCLPEGFCVWAIVMTPSQGSVKLASVKMGLPMSSIHRLCDSMFTPSPFIPRISFFVRFVIRKL